jgi:predicted membrane-bound spermidine synthase
MDARAEFWITVFGVLFLLVVAGARFRKERIPWVPILFFCSGFPALIYQIVWQRALFAIYGINIQSVTIVVSAFMLGLGLGSLLGGALSKSRRLPLVKLFSIAELGTGAFGLVSLKLFHRIAEVTAGSSLLLTGIVSFSLVVLPTLFMGATLPVLVEHLVRTSKNVAYSVGLLYFVNTLGSAFACFLAADVLMRLAGQSGSVSFAAIINVSVGIAALLFHSKEPEQESPAQTLGQNPPMDSSVNLPLPFPLALRCAAIFGFIALSYEIIWFRLLAFATFDTARAFASLLGAYLFGLAIGSRFIAQHAYSSRLQLHPVRQLVWILIAASVLSFMVGPGCALLLKFQSPNASPGNGNVWPFLLITFSIIIVAALFGATFPMLAYASIDPNRQAGKALSHLYAANIIGSTSGTLVVGFILMEYLSVFAISLLLLIAGLIAAVAVYKGTSLEAIRLKPGAVVAVVITFLAVTASKPLLDTIYDRLLFKKEYPKGHFQRAVENRSGVIGVTPDGVLWGGGVYDGQFSVDLLHDVNIIVRPFALSAFHSAPRHVLMIGLGSGSWAQVVANHPQLEGLTIVEINPGYLQLLPSYPVVASLLHNPKVYITIDDGRRWLLQNDDKKFDVVVMNTTFYWRDHASNLLSTEFLKIVRRHLNPGGVFFYNTTGSDDAIATGLSVFPYGLRIVNALAVSDAPLGLDRARWRTVLLSYVIDGKRVVDTNDPEQLKKLDELVNLPENPPERGFNSVETNDQLRRRLQNRPIITDDNMGSEWR